MTRLAIVVGPARQIAIRICVLLDGVDDCVQLRNRDGAVLRRCKGRRDLLRDSKRINTATRDRMMATHHDNSNIT